MGASRNSQCAQENKCLFYDWQFHNIVENLKMIAAATCFVCFLHKKSTTLSIRNALFTSSWNHRNFSPVLIPFWDTFMNQNMNVYLYENFEFNLVCIFYVKLWVISIVSQIWSDILPSYYVQTCQILSMNYWALL